MSSGASWYPGHMTRAEQFAAFLALAATVIGAAFWLGSTMATKDDVAEIRRVMDTNMRELRTYIVDHLDGHPARAPD